MKKVDWAGVRRWGYVVAAAGIPLLVAYGIVTADKAPLWVAFAGAALGFPIAAMNTHSSALANEVATRVQARIPSAAEVADKVVEASPVVEVPSAVEVAQEVAQVAPTAQVPSVDEVASKVAKRVADWRPSPIAPVSGASGADVLDPGVRSE
ncbi:hypothetical protein VVR12_03385 [Rothia sp. LK2588]|uniref:hypothetical protein n=1 Tax=Rothia sp. LK2588 TaxID=3114369 RepID=UPI0034CE1891